MTHFDRLFGTSHSIDSEASILADEIDTLIINAKINDTQSVETTLEEMARIQTLILSQKAYIRTLLGEGSRQDALISRIMHNLQK